MFVIHFKQTLHKQLMWQRSTWCLKTITPCHALLDMFAYGPTILCSRREFLIQLRHFYCPGGLMAIML